ncbi:hypothetical protein FOA52_010121 [Chlamydomonas sp. UWO 241]|nr:hypothetical protein FOA52_010121 [Chlamydomonas sp. UWO 241]
MHLQRIAAGAPTASLRRPAPVASVATPCTRAPAQRGARWVVRAEPEALDTEGLESEAQLKAKKAAELRAAEKFMVIGSGSATCKGCGYEYKPELGDPDFPIPRGMKFAEVPSEYNCPICGAPKSQFEKSAKVVAGFAQNQGYGLGTNSMTGDQKQLLIYGSLAIFFALFIAGYGLE